MYCSEVRGRGRHHP